MQDSFSKIVLVGGVVLAAMGGVLLWLLFSANSASLPTQTQTQRPYFPNTTQTSGTSSEVQTNVPLTAQALNIDAAYAAVFTKLLAQPIVFSTVDARARGDAAAVYALYDKDIAIVKSIQFGATDLSVQMSFIDLNHDGTPEAIVYNNLPGFCGAGGCELAIYERAQGKWTELLTTLANSSVGLANNTTNDYSDLLLTTHSDLGEPGKIVRHVFDNGHYVPHAVEAVWDGTEFVVAR